MSVHISRCWVCGDEVSVARDRKWTVCMECQRSRVRFQQMPKDELERLRDKHELAIARIDSVLDGPRSGVTQYIANI
jgi:hypothetical protein